MKEKIIINQLELTEKEALIIHRLLVEKTEYITRKAQEFRMNESFHKPQFLEDFYKKADETKSALDKWENAILNGTHVKGED